jgi:multiple sugar transport system substrate-binding protein
LGGETAFFAASWQTGLLSGDPTLWALPWLADVHVIYFWRDALEKAGISDYEAAFGSVAALADTLGKLRKDGGFAYPLTFTTIPSPVILHEAAHYVWNAGGDFLSPDGKKVVFNQPAGMAGFRNYFNFKPFISPETLGSSPRGTLFYAGQSAVYTAGPFPGNIARMAHSEWGDRLGIVQSPGPTFVGGSSFVIWQYSRHPQEAFELVRFLSSQPTRIPVSPHDQGLPTRREALNMASVEEDIFHRTFLQALQVGRGFPTIRLWGSIEDKLIVEIAKIWAELFADPDQDLDACLHKHLDPLAERLNILLAN